MKLWLVSLLAIAVSGCAEQNTATTYRAHPTDYCSTVAQQRVQDETFQGHSEDVQKRIFADTDAACRKEEAGYVTRIGLRKSP